jgi:hypothetical protein
MNARASIAWTAVGIAMLITLWSELRPRSYSLMMMRQDPASSATIISRQITDLDDNATKFAPPEGNLALGFQGYSAARADDANFAARLFFRSTYTLYPQRVYPAVPDDTLINTGDDILLATAPPTRDWLGAHNIRMIAVFSKMPSGESFVRPIAVPKQ